MSPLSEPCDLSAVDARRAIESRRLSPVELLESCISRIEAVDPALNAFVSRDFQRARQEARRQESMMMRGEDLPPVHGLPLAVKDLIDAQGMPTTFGSPLFAKNVAAKDEAIVAMLRKAGAIIIGKTNTPEWGAGGNTRNTLHGATGNPFDPTRSCAGSSGGSAVAVATGMVPLATGSDTGGSLRNPAAFNGVVGFRPSPGLIASDSRNMAWLQLSQLGPMTRTVGDACLMLSCMVERHAYDPLSVISHNGRLDARSFETPPEIDLTRLRVAVTSDLGFAPTELAIGKVFTEKCASFSSLFRTVDEAHPDCQHADEIFEVLRSVLFLGRHRELAERHPDGIGPNIRRQVEEGLRYSAVDVARALTLQTATYRAWQDFFREYDFIITPAVTISPRPWRELFPESIDGKPTKTYYHWLALAYAVTNVGHPAIAIPAGKDAAGMPFGLQIVGPRGGDRATLAVAKVLESHLMKDPETARPIPDIGWLKQHPPIAETAGFRDPD